MDFVTLLPILTYWKRKNYNSILVIVDRLTKMVYYEPVQVTINAPSLAEVILDMVVQHHGLSNSIMSDRGSLLISKFYLLLCYFFDIKQKLLIAFYLQTNGQNKQQNSIIEAYLGAFVNFKQNDWARLLLMAKFVYNNAKNINTGHKPFELNYGYYLCIWFEEDVDLQSRSMLAGELLSDLQKLINVYRKNLLYTQELQKQV